MSENQNPSPLTEAKANEIVRALQRFGELKGSDSLIINPRNEAEITGLKNFLASSMIEHGSEFMGCWVAVRSEYEPLIQVLERIGSRLTGIRNNRVQQQLAAQEAQKEVKA